MAGTPKKLGTRNSTQHKKLNHGFQLRQFIICKHPRFYVKPYPQRYFQAKAAAPALGYINFQLRMFPILKLVARHVKFAAANFTQAHIAAARFKLAFGKTHRLRPVATTAALVEHERPVNSFQLVYQVQCGSVAITRLMDMVCYIFKHRVKGVFAQSK